MNTNWLSRLLRAGGRQAAPSLVTGALGGAAGYGVGQSLPEEAGGPQPWLGAGIGATTGAAIGQLPRYLSRLGKSRFQTVQPTPEVPKGPWWEGFTSNWEDRSRRGIEKVIQNPNQVVSGINPHGAENTTSIVNANAWKKLYSNAETVEGHPEIAKTPIGREALEGYEDLVRRRDEFNRVVGDSKHPGALAGLQQELAGIVGKAGKPPGIHGENPSLGMAALGAVGRGVKALPGLGWRGLKGLSPNRQDVLWGGLGGVSQAAKDLLPGMQDDTPHSDLVADLIGTPAAKGINAAAKWLMHKDYDPETDLVGGKRWGRVGNAVSHGLLSMMAHRVGRGLPNFPARYTTSVRGDRTRVDPTGMRWAGTRAAQGYALGGPWGRAVLWPVLNREGAGWPEKGLDLWKILAQRAKNPFGETNGKQYRPEAQMELREPEQQLGNYGGVQFKEQPPPGTIPAEIPGVGFGRKEPDIGQQQLPIEAPPTKDPIPPLKGNPLAPTGKPRPELSAEEMVQLNRSMGTRLTGVIGREMMRRPEVHSLLFTPDGEFKPLWWEDRATIDEIGRITGKPMLWDEFQKAMMP